MPTECDERLAPDHLAQICQGGQRAYFYALRFVQHHALEGSHIESRFTRFCTVLDELLMSGNHDAANSAGAEITCRYLYAMEEVMQNVTKKDHWAGAESVRRTNWEPFERYDVLEYYTSGVEA